MRAEVIALVITLVCSAAFIGAVFGVVGGKAVLKRITNREARRAPRAPLPSVKIDRLLNVARELVISVAELDEDLGPKGRGAHA